MTDTSTPHEAERPRVFISYSHADRQRVAGLVSLLRGLGHHVFIDDQAIRAGRRWEDELEAGLQRADVLLVFWTRHAARSKWVYREYETFAREFPDRPLVPVRGDTTALPPRLQVRQYSDFCPLLNDLLDTVRDLKAKRAGNRRIRTVVLDRLQAEGIELPPDRLNLVLGLFGIPGWVMLPLYYLLRWRDLLADKIVGLADEMAQQLAPLPSASDYTTKLGPLPPASYYTTKLTAFPAASYYTAGIAVTAVTAGFITCHVLSESVERPFIEFIKKIRAEAVTGGIPVTEVINRVIRHDEEVKARPAKLLQQPELFPVDVRLNQSGNDACDAQGMICVSMSRSYIYDENDKFFSYTTPPCSAKVIRESRWCPQAFQTNYALKGIVARRSPEADVGVRDLSRFDDFCMTKELGQQGIYQFANCIKP